MSAAIGGTTAPSRTPEGAIWFDVRDFGAKADNGVTDNSGPIQAAIDALAVKMGIGPGASTELVGVVYIPSAPLPYFVSKTVWVDYPGIEIRGDGWGTQVFMQANVNQPVFQFGARRTEYTTVSGTLVPRRINASYRPDLFGKLDTSAVSAANTRWGIRTNNDSFVQIQASPLSSGVQSVLGPLNWDNWTESSKLTVEFCIEPPDGQQFPVNASLLGLGFPYLQPSPFFVATGSDPTQILVTFKTADFSPQFNQGSRGFAFALGGASRPYRIAFQIDLNNAVCSAFVNGTQVPFTSTNNLAANSTVPFTAGSGLRFQQNDYFPLMIGNYDSHGSYQGTTGLDLRLYGLHCSNALRYQNNGAGQPQVRSDAPGFAVNDAFSYFTNDGNTIGYLPMSDNPATAGRTVTVQHGNTQANGGTGAGLFLHNFTAGNMSNNAIRHIYVKGGGGFSQAISIGAVYEMSIDHVKALNAFHGVGSLNLTTNYNIYLTDCVLQGFDAAYYGIYQLVSGRNLYCQSSGRATFRLVGSNSHWENVFIAFAQGNAECFFKFHGDAAGGGHSITNLLPDFEGYSLSRAAIYCEAHANTPCTTLALRDIFIGTVGANTPLVMLKDMGPLGGSPFSQCSLVAENLQAQTNSYLAAIDVDGPNWMGEVKATGLDGPRFNHRKTWGPTTRVVIRESKFTGPPRAFPWYAGAHVLEVRSPADGQFAEWRCLTTGAYGTPAPPKWLGVTPLSLAPNGLAAYVLNHAYMTVSLH